MLIDATKPPLADAAAHAPWNASGPPTRNFGQRILPPPKCCRWYGRCRQSSPAADNSVGLINSRAMGAAGAILNSRLATAGELLLA
jgi:hypothetical protein